MKTEPLYIFADPFSRPDSGVTSYIKNSVTVLKRNKINTCVVSRKPRETIEKYRDRFAKEVIIISETHENIFVEAPESDAATSKIPSGVADIHIRLHCSRQFGAFIQRENICIKSLELEQQEISRAQRVSAPSRSALIASSILFDLHKEICCYPNPSPTWAEDVYNMPKQTRTYVLFVGRFHFLKGTPWVLKLAKLLPEETFVIACPTSDLKYSRTAPSNLRFIDASNWSKFDVYAQAKLVIIPSIYETASMVGIEALTVGTPLIAWNHLGIAEYATFPSI